MISHIENAYLSVAISSLGAELYGIRACSGTDYLWNGDPAYWRRRAPILFPFVGRLLNQTYLANGIAYPMGIHGFASSSEFAIESRSETAITYVMRENAETLLQYPYHFTFRVIYALSGSALSMRMQVINNQQQELFFGIGGHPGFRVPLENGLTFTDYALVFDEACAPLRIGITNDGFVSGSESPFPLTNGRVLPLTHAIFDHDAIVLKNMPRTITLCSRRGKKAVTVRYPQMQYLGIWQSIHTDAPFVCIEPWASLPVRKGVVTDIATEPGLIHLPGGEIYESTITIEICDRTE